MPQAVIYNQRVETHSRKNGHTEEDGNTGQQRFEFMLYTWVVISKNEEHQQHRGEANCDSKAGSEQDAGNYS